MSPLISRQSHNAVNLLTVVYGGIIALGFSLTVYQLTKIPEMEINRGSKTLYIIMSHVSAIAFALLGEVSFLRNFALTSGCWKRLPFMGKIVISLAGLAIGTVIIYQLIRSYRRKKIFRETWPLLLILVSWFVVWLTMVMQKNKHYIHIHHALFGSFFACCFWDFTSSVDIIANAIFMGITIEGIDFFGISELHLFILRSNFPVHIMGVIVVWCVVILLQMIAMHWGHKHINVSPLEISFIKI
tara:strand:- start:464 stop:1192 length:729 start_codon:yes stop_codon:yes gene_type:complete